METITLTQLARRTDLAPPTIKRYLEQFSGAVPGLPASGAARFPVEAVPVIERIHEMSARGASPAEIAAALGASRTERDPVPAVSPGDLSEVRRVLVMLARRIKAEAAGRDRQLAELQAEVAELRAQVAELRQAASDVRPGVAAGRSAAL